MHLANSEKAAGIKGNRQFQLRFLQPEAVVMSLYDFAMPMMMGFSNLSKSRVFFKESEECIPYTLLLYLICRAAAAERNAVQQEAEKLYGFRFF